MAPLVTASGAALARRHRRGLIRSTQRAGWASGARASGLRVPMVNPVDVQCPRSAGTFYPFRAFN
jgi:hypothetical protein